MKNLAAALSREFAIPLAFSIEDPDEPFSAAATLA